MVYNVSISTHIKNSLISDIFTNKGKFAVLIPSRVCLPHNYIQGDNVQFKLFESFATIYPSQPYEFKQYFICRGIVGHISEQKSAED